MATRCTVEDVAWAREVIASPERTAALVEAFHANPRDPDTMDAVLFVTEVLNERVE